MPALDTARQQPGELLRRAGRGEVQGGRGVRPVLAAGQFALALVLLCSAGILLRSFANLLDVERGFDAMNIVAIDINLPGARYSSDASVLACYDQLLPELRALPGVEGADAISTLLLLLGLRSSTSITWARATPTELTYRGSRSWVWCGTRSARAWPRTLRRTCSFPSRST